MGITGNIIGGVGCGEGNILDYTLYTGPATSTMPPCGPGPGAATNIGGFISFISTFIPPGGPVPPTPTPSGPTARDTALDRAYLTELLITYDLKRFTEFNEYLKRYYLIYMKTNLVGHNKEEITPEYIDSIFKDLKEE